MALLRLPWRTIQCLSKGWGEGLFLLKPGCAPMLTGRHNQYKARLFSLIGRNSAFVLNFVHWNLLTHTHTIFKMSYSA